MRIPSVLLALGVVAAIPAAAQASTLQVEGNEVVYRGAAGEQNNVYINEQQDCDAWGSCQDVFYVAENNDMVPVGIGAGCWQDFSNPDFRSFRCLRGDGNPTKVRVVGGDMNDTLELNGAIGALDGGEGDDQLYGGRGADVIDGGPGNDTIDPDFGMDQSWTLVGGDTVKGGDGNDTIDGTPLDDILEGGPGDDELRGGEGDDRLRGGTGADQLLGEGGTDEADYSDSADPNGVWISLREGISKEPDTPADTFSSIEAARGSKYNDYFESVWTGGIFRGGAGDDYINAGPGHDVIYGEAGNDQFNNAIGSDDFYGGSGTDIAFYGGTVPLTLSPDNVANDGAAGENDNMHGDVEVFYGGSADDVIRGNTMTTKLVGGAGNDKIYGGAGSEVIEGDYPGLPSFQGDDYIDPGKGADTVHGGPGRDKVDYSNRAAAVTVTLGAGSADDGEAGEHDDIADDVEDVTGGSGGDTLVGDADPNTLIGGGGDDTLDGGFGRDILAGNGGKDTVSYASRTTGVTVQLGNVADVGNADDVSPGNDLKDSVGDDVENVTGGAGDDTLTGTNGDNVLDGGAGNDTLSGLGANDTLRGGTGADVIDGGSGSDTATYSDRTGAAGGVTLTIDNAANDGGTADEVAGVRDNVKTNVENLTGGAGNDTLWGNSGVNRLDGGAGNDALRGRAGDDTLLGGDGDDNLQGGENADVLDGGAGTGDTASYTDRTLATDGVSVTINNTADDGSAFDGAAGARDDVRSTVENVQGGAGNDVVWANSGVNRLDGGAGDDVLHGQAGNDTLLGGVGNDTLDGNLDADLLDGGAGLDKFSGGDGVDTLKARDSTVETITCGAGTPDAVTADTADNVNADCESVSRA